MIAIVGPGSIGCAMSAHLWKAGHRDQVLCARTPLEDVRLETPEGVIEASPRVETSPERVEPPPWVLLTTKADQVEGAAAWLGRLCRRETKLAVIQNGVEHRERVAPYANGATVVPVVINCPVMRSAPGRVVQRRTGTVDVGNDDASREFAALLEPSDLQVTVTDDLVTAMWHKLTVNVAGGAITAATNKPMGVIHEPGMAQLALDLMHECIAVGRAEGAKIDEGLADELLSNFKSDPHDLTTSMLMDRRAGRTLEVDARNGAVVRIGRRHGIDTPANAAMTAQLKALGG